MVLFAMRNLDSREKTGRSASDSMIWKFIHHVSKHLL
jgi:hypothetical protein